MSMQVEKLEKNMAKLTIEVDAAKVNDAIKKAYDKNKGKMSVPGFRKGKVPQAMIEKMYGPEVFYEDAANFLIPDAYAEEVEAAKDLEVVSQPKIDVVQMEKGKNFIFTAEVALKPPVDLGKYKGVKIEKIDTEVTDEDIDKEIKREQEANARTITVEDRPVKDGDTAVIDF
ncbi:MAG: trigger factor, partial [Lachnospiraceae bacterium]|nr:trigger factor [Lachnospiraceae bacterium]